MLKNLTLLAVAGLLANTGCIINTGGTDTDTDNTTTTSGTTTDGTGTGTSGTTDGTGTSGTSEGSSTDPTTGPTTSSTTTSMTSSSSTGSTTDGSEYGKCGWNAENKYYACESGGGVPGEVDPVSPIDCPDVLPAMGDKCDETTPVNNVGCCLPDGTNYYCDADGMIQIEACGA